MKRIFSLILAVLLLLFSSGCSKENKSVEIVDDKYRNVYEIFVASFCDSNGDGTGDINGVTSKLDYLQEMGYTAIWLMPIHPSPSYHKYDVTDYYDIDPSYGTLQDFDNLVAKAHEKNINIIIDLVVNHTSDKHQWFINAWKNALSGQSEDYVNWYNFSTTPQPGYATKVNGLYYEARFVNTMPDLNLDNKDVRAEIVKIMKFWLDRGVDGFRLDAVTSYVTGNSHANVTFLAWLNEQAKAIKNDCYIVGECWDSDTTIRNYYNSGVDSFFHFSFAQADGTIAKTLNVSSAPSYFRNALKKAVEITNGHIPAIFLDNHDVNRITGGIGRSQLEKLKFVYGLAGMFNGCLYTYYGTEIGMIGSGKDENKRIAMLWDSDDASAQCKNPSGSTQWEYAWPGVKQQQKDKNSLLNYHKQINYLRNKYPQIARGEMKFYDELMGNGILVFEKTWNEQSVAIVINFSNEETATVDLSSVGEFKTFEYAVASTGKVTYKGSTLQLPPYSIAVLADKK
jgi:glycosidase